MSLNLMAKNFIPKEQNIFNLRDNLWGESQIISSIKEMLKAPSEKYDFIIEDIKFVDRDINHKELKKTISKDLVINIIFNKSVQDKLKEEMESAEHVDEEGNPVEFHYEYKKAEIKYDIPWLINNHFFVGGNKKIPVYQLYDFPVITRCKNKDLENVYGFDMVKLRGNIYNFGLSLSKRNARRSYFYSASFMSKDDIPLVALLHAYYGLDKITEKYKLNLTDDEWAAIKKPDTNDQRRFNELREDFKILYSSSINLKNVFKNCFLRKTDAEIIENILLITDIDIFTKKYLRTNNYIEELEYTILNGSYDVLKYENKRLRFTEYLVFYWICRDFYNIITNTKAGKKERYCNNSKTIIKNINVSDITQYDFCINPIDQLSMLTKTTMTGPGGFEKDNVPSYLRDLHPSTFGRICPADTGDRENCGTIQYLVPNSNMNEDLVFDAEINEKCLTSLPVSNTPFLEHDDATRLQMSSSHQRHAIMIKNSEPPLIGSGLEGLYSKYSTFMFLAQHDGEVVLKNENMIIVKYDNNTYDSFHIGYKKLALTVVDVYKCYFELNERFKKDDIICESKYLDKGRFSTGKNLLTAIMVWHGYNFEDAIVISDDCVNEDKLTSLHYLDMSFDVSDDKVLMNLTDDMNNYKPVPDEGDVVNVGDIYARIKSVSNGLEFIESIFDKELEYTCSENCVITNVEVYANSYNKEFPQYKDFIEKQIKKNQDRRNNIIETLSKYFSAEQVADFLNTYDFNKFDKKKNNFKIKNESIDGLRIEITAVYERKMSVGDKIANRHGNKGVISIIVPRNKMPRLKDGRICDVILNPLGIISRMNIGQLFELHLTMSLMDLKKRANVMINVKDDISEIKMYILKWIKIVDKTGGQYQFKDFVKYIDTINTYSDMTNFVEEMYIIQPPFESIKVADLFEAMQYTETEFEYDCYDPLMSNEDFFETTKEIWEERIKNTDEDEWEKNINNPIAFGYMYFMKLNHIAKDKIAARSVGPYGVKTCQPLEGKSRKGGQRVGEMEIWGIASHNAERNLTEMVTTKSDSIKKRNDHISSKMYNEDKLINDDNEDGMSQSSRLLECYLNAIGVEPDYDNEDDNTI